MSLLDKCYSYNYPDTLKEKGIYPYFKSVEDSEGPVVQMGGKKVIMAGSNNYLGLSYHPLVKEASIKAIEKYGTSCSGSRFMTGTTDLHEEMEEKIASFMGKEAALLFSSGFQTAQGIIYPMVSRGDIILSDRDNHASIVVGNSMTSSLNIPTIRYHHNNMEDLERRLDKLPAEQNKLIVTDGVFSTLGTVTSLDEITKLAKTYNANVIVDDAHGFGVIGDGGRGAAHSFGVENDVDLIMSPLSKSLASVGGFVVGEERVINYLKHKSPALMFSTSPAPASVAAALAALAVLKENPMLPKQVTNHANKVREGLKQAGFTVIDGASAIVPVIIGDNDTTFKFWKTLYEENIFVNAFVSPGVPEGLQMLRLSFMATHNDDHLNYIIDTFIKVGKKLSLISAATTDTAQVKVAPDFPLEFGMKKLA